MALEVPESVYYPSEDSLLAAEVLERKTLKGKKILDMGTGSGILAILAAKKGAKVDACDINPNAIACTRAGAKNSGMNVNVFVSDLFENVNGKYDIIMFNPPYLPEDEDDKIAGRDERYSGGRCGLYRRLRTRRKVCRGNVIMERLSDLLTVNF